MTEQLNLMKNLGVWGTDSSVVKNLHYNFDWPSRSMVLHLQIQPTGNHIIPWNIFIEKYLHLSGTMQFKPVLFKGQLYCDFILLKG